MENVEISTPMIPMNQLLKLIGIAATGGQANLMVEAGKVSLNGETVSERRRKVRVGDIVRVSGEGEYRIVSG